MSLTHCVGEEWGGLGYIRVNRKIKLVIVLPHFLNR
jgi:hypothetical protein